MRENEEVFRNANERLRKHIEGVVSPDRPVPFLCECMDERCLDRIEMTLDEYSGVRGAEDRFAVAPGHAAPQGEIVLERRAEFDVVQKEAPV